MKLIKTLYQKGFKKAKIKVDLQNNIELLLSAGDEYNEKLEVLDKTVFNALCLLYPGNDYINQVLIDYEKEKAMVNNDGFNTQIEETPVQKPTGNHMIYVKGILLDHFDREVIKISKKYKFSEKKKYLHSSEIPSFEKDCSKLYRNFFGWQPDYDNNQRKEVMMGNINRYVELPYRDFMNDNISRYVIFEHHDGNNNYYEKGGTIEQLSNPSRYFVEHMLQGKIARKTFTKSNPKYEAQVAGIQDAIKNGFLFVTETPTEMFVRPKPILQDMYFEKGGQVKRGGKLELFWVANTEFDANVFEKKLEKSDYYAEREGLVFIFPVKEHDIDNTEAGITKEIVDKINVFGHFERHEVSAPHSYAKGGSVEAAPSLKLDTKEKIILASVYTSRIEGLKGVLSYLKTTSAYRYYFDNNLSLAGAISKTKKEIEDASSDIKFLNEEGYPPLHDKWDANTFLRELNELVRTSVGRQLFESKEMHNAYLRVYEKMEAFYDEQFGEPAPNFEKGGEIAASSNQEIRGSEIAVFEKMLQEKINASTYPQPVKVVEKQKYVLINVGSSGKFMYDKDNGHLYYIKGYGVIDRKKDFGLLSDIVKFDFDWEGYSIVTKGSTKKSGYGFAGPILDKSGSFKLSDLTNDRSAIIPLNIDWFREIPDNISRKNEIKVADINQAVTQQRINDLRTAGLSDLDIKAVFWGYPVINPEIKADTEFYSYSGGLMEIMADYQSKEVYRILKVIEKGFYEAGIKSPEITNWDKICKKYGLSLRPEEYIVESNAKNPRINYFVWEGNGILLGKNIWNRDNESFDVNEVKINGDYVGIVTNNLEILKSILKDIFSVSENYAKDINYLLNGLGGIRHTDIEQLGLPLKSKNDLSKPIISKAAQDILKPEWDAMEDFFANPNGKPNPEGYEVVGDGIVKFINKEKGEQVLKSHPPLDIGYQLSFILDKGTKIELGAQLPTGWYAWTQRSGYGNKLPMKPLTLETLQYYDKKVQNANTDSKINGDEEKPEQGPLKLSDIPKSVKAFMPVMQQKAIVGNEEVWDVIYRLKKIIDEMPVTYQTEDTTLDEKMVWLHYFYGGSDWYIVEKDMGDFRGQKDPVQHQAFGYSILNGDHQMAEWGYISIEELKSTNKIELDFYFQPIKFGELKKKWEQKEEKKAGSGKVYFGDKITPVLEDLGFDEVYNELSHVNIFYKGRTFDVQDNSRLKEGHELSYSIFEHANGFEDVMEIGKIKEGEYGSLTELGENIKTLIDDHIAYGTSIQDAYRLNKANGTKVPVSKIYLFDNRSFGTYDQADKFLFDLINQQRHSDCTYKIVFKDGREVAGSIDMEPYSHWEGNTNPFTWYINTYWPNVAKSKAMGEAIPQSYIDEAKDIVENYDLGDEVMLAENTAAVAGQPIIKNILKVVSEKADVSTLDDFTFWWTQNFILKKGNHQTAKSILKLLNLPENIDIIHIYTAAKNFNGQTNIINKSTEVVSGHIDEPVKIVNEEISYPTQSKEEEDEIDLTWNPEIGRILKQRFLSRKDFLIERYDIVSYNFDDLQLHLKFKDGEGKLDLSRNASLSDYSPNNYDALLEIAMYLKFDKTDRDVKGSVSFRDYFIGPNSGNDNNPVGVFTREGMLAYRTTSDEDAKAWVNDRYDDEPGLVNMDTLLSMTQTSGATFTTGSASDTTLNRLKDGGWDIDQSVINELNEKGSVSLTSYNRAGTARKITLTTKSANQASVNDQPTYITPENLTPKEISAAPEKYSSAEKAGETDLVNMFKGKKQSVINNEIRALLTKKGTDRNNYSADEIAFLKMYEGDGGLIKEGAKGARILDQFFTPVDVCGKMWGLALKYGFNFEGKKNILEPSVGSGRFLQFIPATADVNVKAFDVDETSYMLCKVLFPDYDIVHGSFEATFFQGNRHIGLAGVKQQYDLVIGNPPYRDYVSEYSKIGEKKATGAETFDQYFIMRGVDVLKKGGVLVMIIPSSFLANGEKYNSFKQDLAKKAEFLDAYRLPNGTFGNTQVGTDIIVLRKK